MVSQNNVIAVIGAGAFIKARQEKGRNYEFSPGLKQDILNGIYREESQKLEKALRKSDFCYEALIAEYLDTLKFYIYMEAGVDLPMEELKRITAAKNPDGTSTYTGPNPWL